MEGTIPDKINRTGYIKILENYLRKQKSNNNNNSKKNVRTPNCILYIATGYIATGSHFFKNNFK